MLKKQDELWWNAIGDLCDFVRLVTISPQAAAVWLKRNRCNRKLKESSVDKIARGILRGEWVFNGQPIILSTKGDLLDGQHRLNAIVRSGMSVMSLVVFDIDPEAFPAIDSGKSRNADDVIHVSGGENSKQAASISRHLLMHLLGQGWHTRETRLFSNSQILDVYRNYPDVAVAASRDGHFKSVGHRTFLCLYWLIASRISASLADEFFHQVSTGEGIAKGMPAYALRERLLANRARRGLKAPEVQIKFFIAKSLAMHFARKPCNTLVSRRIDEAWPVIPGDKLFGLWRNRAEDREENQAANPC